jgi:hypothetical protein
VDAAAVGHPILETGVGPESDGFWSSAPGIYWALPVRAAKPGATILLRCADVDHPDGMPLVAVQPYGAGRVVWCGTPGTWRWRRAGIEPHERFWLQAIRYCAADRLAGRDRRARISLDRYAYDPGEPVAVRLRLLDEDMGPVRDAAPALSVACDGQPCGETSLRPGAEPGVYQGVIYPEAFGRYSVVYEADDGVRASESFDVRRPEAEFRDTRQDDDLLRGLAAATGGRYFGPSQIARIPGAIPDRTRVSIRPGPPEPLWDRPWVLALLVGVLAAEWIARKRMGLL